MHDVVCHHVMPSPPWPARQIWNIEIGSIQLYDSMERDEGPFFPSFLVLDKSVAHCTV